MSDADLELHIDELVAGGLSEREARGLASAIERHLGLLVAKRGLPDDVASRHIDRVDIGATPSRQQGSDALAERIAQQVHGAIAGARK